MASELVDPESNTIRVLVQTWTADKLNDEGCIQASYDELIKYIAPFNKGNLKESRAVSKSPTECTVKLSTEVANRRKGKIKGLRLIKVSVKN